MKYIQLTKGKITVVDDEYYDILSQYKWQCHNNYAKRAGPRRNNKQTKIYMHRVVMELSGITIPSEMQIDHISRNKLDNRKENLRIASRAQNQRNHSIRNSNTSGYKGVYWHTKANKWVSQINIDGIGTHLGLFSNIIHAALAYDRAAKEHHGEFAFLNFPSDNS